MFLICRRFAYENKILFRGVEMLVFSADLKKRKAVPKNCLSEPLAGLEPATHALRMRCSTN